MLVKNERFSVVLSVLPERIRAAAGVPFENGTAIDEIRLRKGLPVAVTVSGKSLYLCLNGAVSPTTERSIICTEADIKNTFIKLCDNSVFAHTGEIENGYVALKGGFRAGICGDFSAGAMPIITSINIRIARQIKGCADGLITAFSGGMLISGPPGCGKTTLLRDLIRSLSNKGKRVAVIDSRRELSGGTGDYAFDLGLNTDIIFLHDKAKGAEMALRSMFPQVIAFDEIGTVAEVGSVLEAFNSGVDIITTAHAGSMYELRTRPVTKALIDSGIIKTVVLILKNAGGKMQIYEIGEKGYEDTY